MEVKVSPIFYMGNKKRLIQKGLIDLFPKEIHTFYDLFGGSGVVALNTNANEYVLNELDKNIYNLYLLIKEHDPQDIISHIENRIIEYDLPTKSTNSATTSKEERDYYKGNYMKLRDYYNTYKNPLDLFVLMNYCLSQTMRFNQKGGFNMPFGNNRFIKEKHGKFFVGFHESLNKNNFTINNESFERFNAESITPDDFVYLDPPYIGTTATYNENGKWNEESQHNLLNFCEDLHNKNVKFAMSNVFRNKDYINESLINWCETNNFKVYTFDNFSYHSYGKGDANSEEVLITNF
jgi:DNA adenine methylase Dam